jgi:hypothetical protein
MAEFANLHASVAAVATQHNCSHSLLTPKNVSVHTLPETTSFSSIAALAGAAAREAYIGTVEKDLVFSAHLEPKQGNGGEESELFDPRPSKKRRRCGNTADEEADRVAQARARLAQSAPTLAACELDVAQKVVTKLVCNLRGPNGEIVVQSYAILAKKLGVADTVQRVVVAARLNAGIEMKVQLLKSCLGACWEDGLLTTLPTLHGIGKIELPLSDEASAAALFGNAAILLVTSVPVSDGKK